MLRGAGSQKRTLLLAGCGVILTVDHRGDFQYLVKLLQGLQQAGGPVEANNANSAAVMLSAPAAAAEACLRQMTQ